MRGLFLIICVFISPNLFSQDSNDTIPPPPPPPYLLVDWNNPEVEFAKQNGFELLSIQALSCGVKPDSSFSFSYENEILTASYTVKSNCCMDFIGRINSETPRNLQLELYIYGFEFCTCECYYTFIYRVRTILKNDTVQLSMKYMSDETDVGTL